MRIFAVIAAAVLGLLGGLLAGFVWALAIPGPNTLLIELWGLGGGWVAGYGTFALLKPKPRGPSW